MTQINAYVGFNGQCREAMNFYKECLGGDLIFNTVEGTPMEAQCPPALKNQILHSTLTNGSMVIMATDMTRPDGFIQGNNFALSVNCSSEEEINTLFSKLCEGGKILDPLKEQFWGATFGACTDKFGIGWMLNFDKN